MKNPLQINIDCSCIKNPWWLWISSLIFLLFIFGSHLCAQNDYKFNQPIYFEEEDGLPNTNIRGIIKGDDGFLWITTLNGLCRFDGVEFKVYQHDPNNPNSLLDNRTGAIINVDGKIWVGTLYGISVLDPKTDKFKNYKLDSTGIVENPEYPWLSTVTALYKDGQEDIWVGTRHIGTFRYLPETDNFIHYRYEGKKHLTLFPNDSEVNHIYNFTHSTENDSLIWAGTNTGILEINKYTNERELYIFPLEDKLEQKQFNIFRKLVYLDGLVYVGAWGYGLRTFNPRTKQQGFAEVNGSYDKNAFNQIGLLLHKSDHEIWVGNGHGLSVYDTDQKRVTFWKSNNRRQGESYDVRAKGENYRAWGKNYRGLQLFDPFLQQFEIHSFKHLNEKVWGFVFDVVPHPDGETISTFPGSADGLFHFNKRTETWTKTPFPFDDEKEAIFHPLRAVTLAPDGNLTLVSQSGFYTYDTKSETIKPFNYKPPLKYGDIKNIFWDSKGFLWVCAGLDGLVRWNPRTNTNRIFKSELEPGDPPFLVEVFRDILEDDNSNIWIRRNGGLSVYHAEKDTFYNFIHQLNDENCFSIHISFAEDKFDRAWFLTYENWIGYADINAPEKGLIKKINLEDQGIEGLASFIRTDLEGTVWIVTDQGISKMDPNNFAVTNYNRENGPLKPENYSFTVLPSGEFVIGERNYIAIAKPENLGKNTELPIPYVTEIKVHNEPFLNDTAIFYKKRLNLKYDQNYFSIGFSAQSFRLGDQTRFEYRLKDFEDWVDTEGRNYANYTNVPSGDYVFQLKAYNNEGLENKAFYELKIHISTPWWEMWWFKLLLVFALGSTIYSFYRYRLSQVREREKLKTAFNKKLANVEMTALLAQMNPHFLFNCLNSIESYIVKNKPREASEYLNSFARLMRLILQNSRSNYVSLKEELETIELYIQMETLRLKDKFKYEINVADNIDVSNIDIPPMLIQPYVENAIWHGLMNKQNKEEGLLSINLFRENGSLKFIVKDNGIGRKKAGELKQNKMKTKRKSMGMAITKDRIELINQLYNLDANVKIIDLLNQNNKAAGTEVILEIPI